MQSFTLAATQVQFDEAEALGDGARFRIAGIGEELRFTQIVTLDEKLATMRLSATVDGVDH